MVSCTTFDGIVERIFLPEFGVEADVRFRLREQQLGVGVGSRHHVDHHRQVVVVDENRFGRVDSLRSSFGHDGRDDVTDEANSIRSEERASKGGIAEVVRHRTEVGVRGGIDTDDARHLFGGGRVDLKNRAVREW